MQSLIKIFMSMTQWIAPSAALSFHRSFRLPSLPLLSFLSVHVFVCSLFNWHSHLFPFFKSETLPNLPLIFKPLFIYAFFWTKNIKEVNTTDSSTQPLICSFVFSLSPVHLADVMTACVAEQNCSCYWAWLEDNCGFSQAAEWVLLKAKTALMLMMSCDPEVHQITTASFLLTATHLKWPVIILGVRCFGWGKGWLMTIIMNVLYASESLIECVLTTTDLPKCQTDTYDLHLRVLQRFNIALLQHCQTDGELFLSF